MEIALRAVGDTITERAATAVVQQTAGSTAAVTGITIDRAELGWPESLVIVVPISATLAANETVSLAHTLQTSAASDMSNPVTVDTATATVQATGAAGGSTETRLFSRNVPLRGARRYVRLNLTPTLSRANTDTVRLGGVLVFGGANRLPQ